MLNIHQRYCKETFFNGTLERFETVCPPDFNFAYDVVDEIAKAEPQRRAMLWCNPKGECCHRRLPCPKRHCNLTI